MMKVDLGTCIAGSVTDNPCGRLATTTQPHRLPDNCGYCDFRAEVSEFFEEIDDLSIGLEFFEEWEERARQIGNQPVLRLLEQARAEFTERLKLPAPRTDALERAMRAR